MNKKYLSFSINGILLLNCLLLPIVNCEDVTRPFVDGEAGDETATNKPPGLDINKLIPSIVLPTLDPDFWKNLPTLPPLAWPTLDPELLKNLPTLPPIVLPTLDPDFLKNLPTLPPFVLPTIDPNFMNKLPTFPPIVFPTLDPDFLKKLPTLPPLVLPTLDPDFLKNIPTLPPLPTLRPKIAQCSFKISAKINQETTADDFDDLQTTVDRLITMASETCEEQQAKKLEALLQSAAPLFDDLQALNPDTMTSDEIRYLFLNLLIGDSLANSQMLMKKTLENLTRIDVNSRLSRISTQLSSLQFQLILSSI